MLPAVMSAEKEAEFWGQLEDSIGKVTEAHLVVISGDLIDT